VQWVHPAGIVTDETVAEVRAKIDAHDWARRTWKTRKDALDRWLDVSSDRLREVFPKRRGNVYHNYSCPQDRRRLVFDPFEPDEFRCSSCGRTYPADTDAGIYTAKHRYHGTMYDGWACIFYQAAGAVAADMGLVARIEGGDRYVRRGVELLLLYADAIAGIETTVAKDPQASVLLTYHREGDNKVLNDLTCAYELLREHMTGPQRAHIERVVLQRMLDDILLEPIYTQNHNNLYQWHRTVLQVALALEREDLIDWSFGYGAFDPDRQPEHRSIRRLVATHFKPDGAYWEMCSGYHLYPVYALCEVAVLSRNLVRMDPARFPADRYDLTQQASPGGKVLKAALEWFVSMAMPDRTMPTIGDAPSPRSGMDDYDRTAEVGYRFFDVKAVGDYDELRTGARSWAGLLYGAPEIVRHPTSYSSAYLSSGWVSLRNDWQGNRAWVGLNALIPGGGHQHADRLTLLSYSHGKLLACEKGTPYNESVTRKLGTLSPSHNTVTVDRTSQKQGEALSGDQVPKVAFFSAGPVAKFAELHGDNVYPQTDVYRRSVVLIEDVIVDLFRVRGGKTHDWIVHHRGPAPRFSVPMADETFTPAEWLANGTGRVQCGRTDGVWDAQWRVDGVTSRMTMLGAEGTAVYALETYPLNNAVVTPKFPPCQTLCVRRVNDTPFLAVWDAWRDNKNLEAVTRGRPGSAVAVKTASNKYYLLFGPGETQFEDGTRMKSDAVFSLLRNRDATLSVRGTRLEVHAKEGTLHLTASNLATVSAEWSAEVLTLEVTGDIHYDTHGGQDHYCDAPDTKVQCDGTLWPTRTEQRRAGQAR